jgi:phage-related protein
MRRINFYRTENNKCPIEEFLNELNDKQIQKVYWVFNLVKEQKQVPQEYLKKLIATDDIWEIRVKQGNNIFRLLGFFEGNDLIMLNHGFQKKSQRTPRKEIEIAEKRKLDYLKRKGR